MADLVCVDLNMAFTNPQTGAVVEALIELGYPESLREVNLGSCHSEDCVWDISEAFTLTAGIRYAEDDITAEGTH